MKYPVNEVLIDLSYILAPTPANLEYILGLLYERINESLPERSNLAITNLDIFNNPELRSTQYSNIQNNKEKKINEQQTEKEALINIREAVYTIGRSIDTLILGISAGQDVTNLCKASSLLIE